GSLLAHSLEVNVADDAVVGQAVDAHIDHDGTALDHLRQDQVGFAGSHHQDVGQDGELGQVARLDVTDTHGGFALHEHECHRLADNVTGAHHHHVASLDLDVLVLQQLHHSVGSAGRKNGVADDQATDVV